MGLGILSNIFAPASLIFDDGSLRLNLDLSNVLGILIMITKLKTQFAFAMSDEGPIEESTLHAARMLGYHDLREQQLHAAKKFLQRNDVFVSLPTGSRKSLICAALPFAFDHLRRQRRHHCCRCFTFTLATVTLGRKYIAF